MFAFEDYDFFAFHSGHLWSLSVQLLENVLLSFEHNFVACSSSENSTKQTLEQKINFVSYFGSFMVNTSYVRTAPTFTIRSPSTTTHYHPDPKSSSKSANKGLEVLSLN